MKYPARSIIKRLRIGYLLVLLIAGFSLWTPAARAMTDQVPREKDIVNLRLGQRITVDDGTCPAGQIKEISGSKMSQNGIVRARKCIPRMGPKKDRPR